MIITLTDPIEWVTLAAAFGIVGPSVVSLPIPPPPRALLVAEIEVWNLVPVNVPLTEHREEISQTPADKAMLVTVLAVLFTIETLASAALLEIISPRNPALGFCVSPPGKVPPICVATEIFLLVFEKVTPA